MKKSILLVALLVVPMGIAIAQQGKERSASYKMMDVLVDKNDWPALFEFLDRMQGVIDVNEYRLGYGGTLLAKAVLERNFLAAKTLLEKYKANPNLVGWKGLFNPIVNATLLGDDAMVALLRQYGAKMPSD